MNKRERLLDDLLDGETLTFADGFDDAILGIEYESGKVVYSFTQAIEILQKEMDVEDAYEWMYYNTLSSHGEDLPIWVMDFI
jgi:hypothetical protein